MNWLRKWLSNLPHFTMHKKYKQAVHRYSPSNPLGLTPGKRYKLIKSFTDYDRFIHPVGETWIFLGTNFLPYDDGLTLHVKNTDSDSEIVYRLQWRPEEQGSIIDNFSSYVQPQ